MKNFIDEFKAFALRGNALDLAVGVVIGAAFNSIVTSLVNNVLTPPLGLLMGGVDFSTLSFSLGGDVVIAYGLFLQALVSFVITAFALFLFIKFLAKFAKEKPAAEAAKPADLMVLEEIRDLLRAHK